MAILGRRASGLYGLRCAYSHACALLREANRATTGGCPNGRFAERVYCEGEQVLLTTFSNHLFHMGVIIQTHQTPTVASEP